jgi:hypothetical protein
VASCLPSLIGHGTELCEGFLSALPYFAGLAVMTSSSAVIAGVGARTALAICLSGPRVRTVTAAKNLAVCVTELFCAAVPECLRMFLVVLACSFPMPLP